MYCVDFGENALILQFWCHLLSTAALHAPR